MLPYRLQSMLDSDDIEMVRLGVRVMQQEYPPEKWKPIMEAFSLQDVANPELYLKKWVFKIEGGEITVRECKWAGVDFWALKQKIQMPLLNMNNSPNQITMLEDNDRWQWQTAFPKQD